MLYVYKLQGKMAKKERFHSDKALYRIKTKLNEYNIGIQYGFLRSNPPLKRIMLTKYAEWEDILQEMPQLIISQNLGKRIEGMTVLEDITDLLESGIDVKNRAVQVISMLCSGFIFEPEIMNGKARKYLPRSIAVPAYQLCMDMKVPPIITHGCLVCNNYYYINTDEPLSIYNVGLNNLFLGGIDENYFFVISFGIELFGGKLLKSILMIKEVVSFLQTNSNNNRENADHLLSLIQKELDNISHNLVLMMQTLNKYYGVLDPYIFYKRVRIFLNGYDEQNGIELKGIHKTNKSIPGCNIINNKTSDNMFISCYGASAAQCSIFPCLDIFFGINNLKDQFLHKMLYYMPYNHRQFIFWLQQNNINMTNYIHYLQSNRYDTSSIITSYKKCIQYLHKWRSFHMKIAADFVVAPSKQLNEKTGGTGGSNVLPFLKSIKDRTVITSKI